MANARAAVKTKPKQMPKSGASAQPKTHGSGRVAATAPSAVADDDTRITALDLRQAALSPAMQAYFDKCQEKLGFVPNVLKAYAFDMAKLEAFVAMYNDLMLAPSGLSQARARNDRGRSVVAKPLLLLPRRTRRCGARRFPTIRRSAS